MEKTAAKDAPRPPRSRAPSSLVQVARQMQERSRTFRRLICGDRPAREIKNHIRPFVRLPSFVFSIQFVFLSYSRVSTVYL